MDKRTYPVEKNMREDLYKKMQSADPVAVRLPYAILTKLVELTGLKRYEMNNLMTFSGVTEGSFDSIMRRSCVVPFKGRFTTARKIASLGGEKHCAACGIFQRDPSLKEFLKTADACRYTLKMLQAFAEKHSLSECEQIIEEYVDGLDEGLTRKTMRTACGLKPDAPAPGNQASASSDAAPAEGQQDLRQAFRQASSGDIVADAMNDFEKDAHLLTEGLLLLDREVGNGARPVSCWNTDTLIKLKCKAQERGAHIGKLISQGLFKDLQKRGRIESACMPIIKTTNQLQSMPMYGKVDTNVEYPEQYSHATFNSYVSGDKFRKGNVTTMLRAFDTYIKMNSRPGCQGQLTPLQKQQKAKYEDLKKGLSKYEDLLQAILEHVGERESATLTYRYTSDSHARRYVNGVASQCLARRHLQKLLVDNVDIDIANAMFTIMVWLIDQLKPVQTSCSTMNKILEFDCWREVAKNRPAVLEKVVASMGISVDAKQVVVAIANGGALPEKLKDQEFFINLRRESILLRWIACSMLPEAHEKALIDPTVDWPEAHVFHLFWTCIEDAILNTMCNKVMEIPGLKHLSLHFDGMRVDKEAFDSQESLLRKLEEAVKETHGIDIKLKTKTHRTFFEQLHSVSEATEAPVSGCESLYAPGKCIPLAVATLMGTAEGVMELLRTRKTTGDLRYKAFSTITSPADYDGDLLSLVPNHGLEISEPGSYLVHAENGGNPHCVAVIVDESKWVTIYDGLQCATATVSDVYSMFMDSVDKSTVVTYRLDKTPKEPSDSIVKELLLLRAGGKTVSTGAKEEKEASAFPSFTKFPAPKFRCNRKTRPTFEIVNDWFDLIPE